MDTLDKPYLGSHSFKNAKEGKYIGLQIQPGLTRVLTSSSTEWLWSSRSAPDEGYFLNSALGSGPDYMVLLGHKQGREYPVSYGNYTSTSWIIKQANMEYNKYLIYTINGEREKVYLTMEKGKIFGITYPKGAPGRGSIWEIHSPKRNL